MRPARDPYGGGVPLAVGFGALVLLVGVVGLWSVGTRISGAVIAPGMVVVENNRQVVQHPEGGIVGEIRARDGDRVAAGDVLIRLDDAALAGELATLGVQLLELRARRARLEAERDGAAEVRFPSDLLAAAGAAAEQIEGQRALFAARRETLAREAAQIGERIRQSRNQIAGTGAQIAALEEQLSLIRADLTGQETLLAKGLVQAQKVSALKREAARLAGEIGRLTADISQLRDQIAALEIEALKLESARREAAIAELRDIQVRELELGETRAGLVRRRARLEVRAPVAGVVYGSTVFAEKAVVRAAEPLMYVVPQTQPLLVSARVEALDIDQIHVGQEARLRFTAFNQRLTPEVAGRVVGVSADVIRDEVSGLSYYRVDVAPDADGRANLERLALVPGMPVEAFLKTGERTPLSYLTKPLADYFGRAMREG